MGTPVKFKYGTEAQILNLTINDSKWVEKAFYYPSDKTYFFQIVDGVMRKYGKGEASETAVGVLLNGQTIGGFKNVIELNDILTIPLYYEYNPLKLSIFGIVHNYGEINI